MGPLNKERRRSEHETKASDRALSGAASIAKASEGILFLRGDESGWKRLREIAENRRSAMGTVQRIQLALQPADRIRHEISGK